MDGLHDLDVWLVGSGELAEATGSFCRVNHLAPGEDFLALLRDRRPGFLLVEGVESLPAPQAAELDDLLETCEREGVPRFLWITASPFDPAFLRICRHFTQAFSTDRDHLPLLRDAGARNPALLWPGTAFPVAEPAPAASAQRPGPVVWLGGWRGGWPAAWRAKLLSILDAARPHGLLIVEPADPAALPAGLQRCVTPPPPADDAESPLRRARVVIGADPASAAPHLLPRIVFDAIACGAAVVTPHRFATIWDFSTGRWGHSSWRSLIPVVEDRDTAAAEIERLLSDDELFDETVEACTRIVRFNHTHPHRIARLASAAGIRVIPDAAADPAHR